MHRDEYGFEFDWIISKSNDFLEKIVFFKEKTETYFACAACEAYLVLASLEGILISQAFL